MKFQRAGEKPVLDAIAAVGGHGKARQQERRSKPE
jgi:hypothetical protein